MGRTARRGGGAAGHVDIGASQGFRGACVLAEWLPVVIAALFTGGTKCVQCNNRRPGRFSLLCTPSMRLSRQYGSKRAVCCIPRVSRLLPSTPSVAQEAAVPRASRPLPGHHGAPRQHQPRARRRAIQPNHPSLELEGVQALSAVISTEGLRRSSAPSCHQP